MPKRLDDIISADEKQRQVQIAYDMYVSARKMLVPPDRGVFAMGFMMGMRRGFMLAQDDRAAMERAVEESLRNDS